jgi:Tol biopolymer transport system component
MPWSCALLGALAASAASAQETARVSVDSAGVEGNFDSYCIGPALSKDGLLVAFGSFASNLVPGDTNLVFDVFVHDRATGVVERVSVDSAGGEGNSGAYLPFSITPDGRFVAFASDASNLVAGDTNGATDVFVRDRATGTTERVSVDSAGGESKGGNLRIGGAYPSLSADGRYVAFTGYGDDLVAGDTNGATDVFVHDRTTGATERVSVDSAGAQAGGGSIQSVLSADGRIVAFGSEADDLVAGDANHVWDVFVRDLVSGVTERVSVDSLGLEGDGDSYRPSLSDDGSIVVFTSLAKNLVAGDANQASDVFLHDRGSGLTERVSVDSAGGEAAGASEYATVSSDGRRIAFDSQAPDLVPGDVNNAWDVFVRDRGAGTTERMSVDSSGAEAAGDSRGGAISGGGHKVAFESRAANLVAGDTNSRKDVFIHLDCSVATSTNYGAGVAGTFGVPSLTSDLPVLGATLNVSCENSLHAPTVGILFLGFQRAQLHTHFGGDLLLLPALCVPITFSFGLDTFTGTLPDDDLLCGVLVDLQVVEADPGAVKGVSFTEGLEIVLGR